MNINPKKFQQNCIIAYLIGWF